MARRVPQQTILVADDDDAVRGAIVRSLTREGYAVIETWEGDEALRALEAGTAPDLVLTDVAMPGLSGPELAARVAARWPGVRVAFITGFAGEHAVRLQTSGLPVLVKPFTHGELIAFIRGVLPRPAHG